MKVVNTGQQSTTGSYVVRNSQVNAPQFVHFGPSLADS